MNKPRFEPTTIQILAVQVTTCFAFFFLLSLKVFVEKFFHCCLDLFQNEKKTMNLLTPNSYSEIEREKGEGEGEMEIERDREGEKGEEIEGGETGQKKKITL